MRQWWPTQWYGKRKWLKLLLPFAFLYQTIVYLRRQAYRLGLFSQTQFKVPIIVVGNLTVGGTGKTPLVMQLATTLKQLGYRPGIVSRGYGGKAPYYPYVVGANSCAKQVGDEPLELHLRTNCPVVVAPNRVLAVKKLLEIAPIDVVLSDDGLQHYALGRSLEIGVIDGASRFGNGYCLPAGPCRESPKRWRQLTLRVCHGAAKSGEFSMELEPLELINVKDSSKRLPLNAFTQKKVIAVCGIGMPERFLTQLSALEIDYSPRIFSDHHCYKAQDLEFAGSLPVIMTGKDAVKCARFAQDNWWYLSVVATIDTHFLQVIEHSLTGFHNPTGNTSTAAA